MQACNSTGMAENLHTNVPMMSSGKGPAIDSTPATSKVASMVDDNADPVLVGNRDASKQLANDVDKEVTDVPKPKEGGLGNEQFAGESTSTLPGGVEVVETFAVGSDTVVKAPAMAVGESLECNYAKEVGATVKKGDLIMTLKGDGEIIHVDSPIDGKLVKYCVLEKSIDVSEHTVLATVRGCVTHGSDSDPDVQSPLSAQPGGRKRQHSAVFAEPADPAFQKFLKEKDAEHEDAEHE